MNLKNRKYFISSKIFNFFSVHNKNIFLFVHVNNMTIFESNLISSYCLENKIFNLNVKSSLYKKVFKNKTFLNIFSGPTQIFVFENFKSFLYFFNNNFIKKNFIPLTIFWNNNFFNYLFFFNQLLFLVNNNIKILDNASSPHNKIVFTLQNNTLNFIKTLNSIFFSKKQINYDVKLINKLILESIIVSYK